MKAGDRVQFINNQNEIDPDECEIIECIGNFSRIKRPNGQIIRIFNDRLQLVEKEEDPVADNEDKYNPWDDLPVKGEVWVKSNRFNDNVICETVAIIDPDSDSYQSINTYAGKAQKVMVYPMKSYKALVKRMVRKGYEKKSSKD